MKSAALLLCTLLMLSRLTLGNNSQADSKHDEHDEVEGEPSNIGPEKGITETHKDKGFKLSALANKNFDIKTIKLTGAGPWTLPLSSRMLSQEEENIYRLRNGFFKRIDFNLISKDRSGKMIVKSMELADGDEVVTEGIGFIRIAELTAFGGAPEGHSH